MMTLDQMKDQHIGKVGSAERDKYEFDLKLDVLGEMIKSVRKKRHLTQEQLGNWLVYKNHRFLNWSEMQEM